MVKRIGTGIPGLDKLVEGGIPEGSIVLFSGAPGTFKTITCFQAVYNVAVGGLKSIYVTFEQSEKDILEQMMQFGWDIKNTKGKLQIISLSKDKNIDYLLDLINQKSTSEKFKVIGLDSLSSIVERPIGIHELKNLSAEKIYESVVPIQTTHDNIVRNYIKDIFSSIRESGATAIITSERIDGQKNYSRDGSSSFLSDGVILFTHKDLGGKKIRYLEIIKLRKTKIDDTAMTIDLKKDGIHLTGEVGGL